MSARGHRWVDHTPETARYARTGGAPRWTFAIALVIAQSCLLFAQGCAVAEEPVRIVRELEPFRALNIGVPGEVVLRRSERGRLQVEARPETLELLRSGAMRAQ